MLYGLSPMFLVTCARMLASMSASDPRVDTPPLNWSDLGVSELPTGTVTLLLADVEGSTGLWETQPEAMTAAFASLDRALSDLVAAYGGVRPIEQGEGDSFVIAFGRAGQPHPHRQLECQLRGDRGVNRGPRRGERGTHPVAGVLEQPASVRLDRLA